MEILTTTQKILVNKTGVSFGKFKKDIDELSM